MLNNNTYFGRGGTMVVTVSFDTLNESTDKRIVMSDGKEVWICDYIFPTTPPEKDNETTVLTTKIVGNTNLKIGFERTYTAVITDENNNTIEWNDEYSWNVDSLIDVDINPINDKVKILIEDDDLVDEKFKLQVLHGKDLIGEIVVTIVGMI